MEKKYVFFTTGRGCLMGLGALLLGGSILVAFDHVFHAPRIGRMLAFCVFGLLFLGAYWFDYKFSVKQKDPRLRPEVERD